MPPLAAPRRTRFAEKQERKPLLGIGEMFDWLQPETLELLLEAGGLKFPADLDQDAIAFFP